MLKSASRLETERSEILNSGSTQHLKTLFNESFLWLLLTDVTPHVASFLGDQGISLRRMRTYLLNPKFRRKKSAILCLKIHNFSDT